MNPSISLRAVLAGTIVALAMQALLSLLGLGLDFISFRVNNAVIGNMALVSMIWLIATSAISMFVGGWIAGRVSNSNLQWVGSLHGIVTWALATLITFVFIMPTAEILVGGAAALTAHAMMSAGEVNVSGGIAHITPEAGLYMLRSGQILGSIAIITFVAFMFSAITSVIGGICATRCKR